MGNSLSISILIEYSLLVSIHNCSLAQKADIASLRLEPQKIYPFAHFLPGIVLFCYAKQLVAQFDLGQLRYEELCECSPTPTPSPSFVTFLEPKECLLPCTFSTRAVPIASLLCFALRGTRCVISN